jgi:hypothetical protein
MENEMKDGKKPNELLWIFKGPSPLSGVHLLELLIPIVEKFQRKI